MKVTKYFRIATEGKTADNRTISRTWLEQVAKNYDPKKFSAGIWMEHMRGYSLNSEFGRYGDVVALKTEEDADGKLALYAQLAPSSELIEINKKGKKLFGSAEISENFADTGEAYFVGLGVTDSPASLSVERIQMFSDRKQSPDNVFTEGEGFNFEIIDDSEKKKEEFSLSEKVKNMFSKLRGEHQSQKEDFSEAIEPVIQGIVELERLSNNYSEKFASLQGEVIQLKETVDSLSSDLKKYSQEPDSSDRRPIITGLDGQALTNC